MDVIEELINMVDINYRCKLSKRMTPLSFACQGNHLGIVEKLLAHPDIEVGHADKNGWTPLHHAADRGYLDISFQLLFNGAEVNATTSVMKHSPLLLACEFGEEANSPVDISADYPGCIRLLLDKGANVNASDNEGWTPLHTLCRYSEDADLVRTLIGHWAGVNTKDPDDYTPLSHAAFRGCSATTQVLIDHGASINSQENTGVTPLYFAASDGSISCVEALLLAGADVNLCANDGCSPLIRACEEGHARCADILLQNGADIKHEDEDKSSALYLSAQEGHVDCLQLLLREGADPNRRSVAGCTALQVACSHDKVECAEILLPLSDIDAVDDEGRTALYWACKEGKAKTAEFLLRNGASQNITASDGISPTQIAKLNDHTNIVKLFSDCKIV